MKFVLTDIDGVTEEEHKNMTRVLQMEIVTLQDMSQKALLQLLLQDKTTKHISGNTAHKWFKRQVEKQRAS